MTKLRSLGGGGDLVCGHGSESGPPAHQKHQSHSQGDDDKAGVWKVASLSRPHEYPHLCVAGGDVRCTASVDTSRKHGTCEDVGTGVQSACSCGIWLTETRWSCASGRKVAQS